jgi:hypothetical protein
LAPTEFILGIILLAGAVAGLVRGFLRELGVTAVLLVLLLALSAAEPYLDRGLHRAITMVSAGIGAAQVAGIKCGLILFVVVGVALLAYQGEWLRFRGVLPVGPQAIALGLLVGLVNGYLVGGVLWHYLERYGYAAGMLAAPAPLVTSTMGQYLPMAFLGQPVMFGHGLVLYLAAFLVAARVVH